MSYDRFDYEMDQGDGINDAVKCPKCGCAVCYEYQENEDVSLPQSDLLRCSSCNNIFENV